MAISKDAAKQQYLDSLPEYKRADAGELNDFENRWKNSNEFYESQTPYGDNPVERPGIDDATKRRSWESIFGEAKTDNAARFNDGAGGGDGSGSRATPSYNPSQAWNSSGVTDAINAQTQALQRQMEFLRGRLTRQDEQETERKTQRDQLYGQLMGRAQQNVSADPNTPVVQGQVNAFRAEQDRAKRNYISDVAEQDGPYGNVSGERRMANERTGQATSAFQAELMGREVAAKRAEVADALNSMRGILTADQQANLTQQLHLLDNQMQGLGLSGTNTALEANTGLGYAGLDLQRDLGFGGLDVTRRGQDFALDQFLRQLAQRQYEFDNDLDYRYWSGV